MRRWSWLVVVVATVILGVGAWRFLRPGPKAAVAAAEDSRETEAKPVAAVRTVPLRRGSLDAEIDVYGVVSPAPGAVQTLSVPFESRVAHVFVVEGQKIAAKEAVVEIEPSPDTHLQMDQARSSYQLSEQGLRHVEQQFKLNFATNEQLLQARQTFEDAKLKLESLQHRGIDGPRKLLAPAEALVTKVDVQDGALVAAGGPLVEFVGPGHVEVRLGLELEDLPHVRVGQPVRLRAVNAPPGPQITGTVRAISQAINATTRLVDVFVSLPANASVYMDGYMRGTIKTTSEQGLIAPRSAVLPEEDEYALFTVKDGRAHKHVVQPGLSDDKEVIVTAKDLKPGDRVVVLGNYELEDKAEVREGAAR